MRLKELKKYIIKNGGCTYSLNTNKHINEGYSVSTHLDKSQIIDFKKFNTKILKNYLNKNKDILKNKKNVFGAWHNLEDGKIYLDISSVYKTKKIAVKKGIENNQIAIWDLGNSCEIATFGTGH